jgi:PAS domain S-box-containing protein
MNAARILIVEDEAILAEDLADLLSGAGYEVVGIVSTGEDAVAAAHEFKPDLVLMDIKLRGALDGIGAAERMANLRDTAVVYLTAHDEPDVFTRARMTEPAGYLAKPVSPHELLRSAEMAIYRHRMERRLRDSEERFRTLAEKAPYGMVMIGDDGRFLYVNKAFIEMFGYDLSEAPNGKEWFRKAYPDPEIRREAISEWLTDLHESLPGQERPRVFTVCCKNGDYRRILFRPVQLESGRHLMTCEDVTERERAEIALKESEERYRALVEQANDIIYRTAPSGVITYINPAVTRLTGYAESDITGKHFSAFVHPSYVDRAACYYKRQLLERIPDTYYELPIITRSGASVWLGQNVHLLTDGDRRIGFQAICRDITERKLAEQALEESELRYRTLFERAGDAIFILEAEGENPGRIVSANTAAAQMHGYSVSEMTGLSIADLDAPEEAPKVPDRIARISRGEWIKEQIVHRKKDGTIFPVEITAGLLDLPNRKYILAIDRDVTERVELEAKLRHASKMEAIGRLAGGVAHDFNNLLTAMIGYTDILAQQLPPTGPEIEKLGRIAQAAKRAAELTHQLLAFSRKQMLEVKVLDCNEIILDLEEMLRRLIREDIELTITLDPELPRVKADPAQLEQIIMNLVLNSRDAMPKGGRLGIGTQRVELDETYSPGSADLAPGLYVMLSVSDAGHGMDAETCSRIFDPFFTTKEKGLGTGLGLSTVFGIVMQHNGHISVHSEPGLGTTFKVYLPCVSESGDPLVRSASSNPPLTGAETILVVEDEDAVRKLICEALNLLGYTALDASCPRDAISLCSGDAAPIDLLLTDVILPEMDGRTLYETISATLPAIKVLFVSGYTDDFIVHHGVLDEGVHFMQKPFNVETLAQKVREALER